MGIRKILYAVMLFSSLAHAQFIGYVSEQTVAVQVFTNQSANLASPILQNLGQSSHLLAYCNTGFAGTISLEASADGTFTAPIVISSAAFGQRGLTDTACHVLQAGGYYPTVRARISNYLSGSVTASYTAVAAPIAFAPSGLGSNGPTAPIVCDNYVFFALAPSTTGELVAGLPGTAIYICQMTISWGAATTPGLLELGSATGTGTCSSFSANWAMSVTPSTPQIFQVGNPIGAFVAESGGTNLCAVSGANGATAEISISFAQR